MFFILWVGSNSDTILWNKSDSNIIALSSIHCHSIAVCEEEYSGGVWRCDLLIHNNENTSTKMHRGKWFHILSRKKWHWWSHQSGLWMHCHLHGPSTAVRHSDCQVNRAHGPQREVRSLFPPISHALGQNNKHSNSRQIKTCIQDIILYETLCLNPVLDCSYIYAMTIHTLICECTKRKDIARTFTSRP